jgi:hypothetical protein
VTIQSTGGDNYTMNASTPVKVDGGSNLCHLGVGTTLATFSGSGTSFTGKHGLWSTTNCAFSQWTSLHLVVGQTTAVASLGSGGSITLTRVPTVQGGSDLWLILLVLVIAALIVAYLLIRRRRGHAQT